MKALKCKSSCITVSMEHISVFTHITISANVTLLPIILEYSSKSSDDDDGDDLISLESLQEASNDS